MRLPQELLDLPGLDRLVVTLDLRHGLADFLGARRAGLTAQLADRLLDETERAVEREPTAPRLARRGRGRHGARGSLAHGLGRLLPAAPPSTPAAPSPTPARTFAITRALD